MYLNKIASQSSNCKLPQPHQHFSIPPPLYPVNKSILSPMQLYPSLNMETILYVQYCRSDPASNKLASMLPHSYSPYSPHPHPTLTNKCHNLISLPFSVTCYTCMPTCGISCTNNPRTPLPFCSLTTFKYHLLFNFSFQVDSIRLSYYTGISGTDLLIHLPCPYPLAAYLYFTENCTDPPTYISSVNSATVHLYPNY